MKHFMMFFENLYDSLKVAFATAQWLTLAKVSVCSAIATLTIFYGAATMFQQEGAFTVGVLPQMDKKGDIAISLSETADFATPVTMLGADGIDQMTNISEKWLPEDLNEHDGSHNGEHFIAYTFYVKNTGNVTCNVVERLELSSAVKGADDAVRIRLYKNGEITTFAKIAANNEPESGTIPFESDALIYETVNEKLETDQTIKYTLVIWLEGDDPECLDNIRGGKVKMSMTFQAESAQKR